MFSALRIRPCRGKITFELFSAFNVLLCSTDIVFGEAIDRTAHNAPRYDLFQRGYAVLLVRQPLLQHFIPVNLTH